VRLILTLLRKGLACLPPFSDKSSHAEGNLSETHVNTDTTLSSTTTRSESSPDAQSSSQTLINLSPAFAWPRGGGGGGVTDFIMRHSHQFPSLSFA